MKIVVCSFLLLVFLVGCTAINSTKDTNTNFAPFLENQSNYIRDNDKISNNTIDNKKIDNIRAKQFGSVFELIEGESVKVENLTITLKNVDGSFCPKDALCEIADTLYATFQMTDQETDKPANVSMSRSMGFQEKPQAIVFLKYIVTADEIDFDKKKVRLYVIPNKSEYGNHILINDVTPYSNMKLFNQTIIKQKQLETYGQLVSLEKIRDNITHVKFKETVRRCELFDSEFEIFVDLSEVDYSTKKIHIGEEYHLFLKKEDFEDDWQATFYEESKYRKEECKHTHDRDFVYSFVRPNLTFGAWNVYANIPFDIDVKVYTHQEEPLNFYFENVVILDQFKLYNLSEFKSWEWPYRSSEDLITKAKADYCTATYSGPTIAVTNETIGTFRITCNAPFSCFKHPYRDVCEYIIYSKMRYIDELGNEHYIVEDVWVNTFSIEEKR